MVFRRKGILMLCLLTVFVSYVCHLPQKDNREDLKSKIRLEIVGREFKGIQYTVTRKLMQLNNLLLIVLLF